jgi:spermidine/putrescine transport system substrate-binding protein
VQDIFESNEMLEAKLKAGADDYDIVVPSSYAAGKMFEQGMIQRLDKERLAPTFKNLDSMVVKKFPESALDYSVPYMMSWTGIAYLKSKVPNFEPSWSMFERPDLRKRMTLLDDYREVLGAALKLLGYSANTTDEAELRAAAEKVLEWKELAAKFDNEQYKQGIASGEFYLVQGYVGDLLQVQEDNEDIEIVLPREGTQFSIDSLAIPTGAKNVDLAYDFINFLHEPANAAKNTEAVMYLCPNKPSYELLPEAIRKNPSIFPDEAYVVEKADLLRNLGEFQPVYQRYWETVKGKDSLDD